MRESVRGGDGKMEGEREVYSRHVDTYIIVHSDSSEVICIITPFRIRTTAAVPIAVLYVHREIFLFFDVLYACAHMPLRCSVHELLMISSTPVVWSLESIQYTFNMYIYNIYITPLTRATDLAVPR